jgi:hypothetical protein
MRIEKHLVHILMLSASLTFGPKGLAAQEVKQSMNSLLVPLRELQPYIANQESFSKPSNTQRINKLLQDLRANFHKLESIPSKYHKLPGFDQNVKQLSDLLDDSTRRFSEGKTSYAWWRLQNLPLNCFSCHATYRVSSSYSNEAMVAPSLDPLERSRFLLATRQFSAAQESLLEVLKNQNFKAYYDQALRSLLVVVTRINKSPNAGIALFKDVLANTKLPEEDAHEVHGWIKGLESWRDSSPQKEIDQLTLGEQLITQGAARGLDYHQDDVSLLRGTALIHEALEREDVNSEQRRRGLYLLGFAYSTLPLYFAEDWAAMYLEQCINEYPGSQDSRRAYRVYREMVLDEFTGSAGTTLPDEVKLHLDALRAKAFGEPSFAGRV